MKQSVYLYEMQQKILYIIIIIIIIIIINSYIEITSVESTM